MKTARMWTANRTMRRSVLYIIFLLSLGSFCQAQEQDLGMRSQLGVRYRIDKKSNVDFSYRLDLKDNWSQFRRSNFSFSYDRKLNKWLDGEIYYRFITNYTQDEHRFRIALSTDKKIYKKTKIGFRTLLQHDMDYLDGDYLRRYKPEWVWRNKLSLDRSINKRWDINIYTEPFISQSYKGFIPYRLRTGAAVSYSKNKWKLSAEYFYQNEFYFENSGLHIIGIEARYDVTRLIRPKKKDKEKD